MYFVSVVEKARPLTQKELSPLFIASTAGSLCLQQKAGYINASFNDFSFFIPLFWWFEGPVRRFTTNACA